jgi:hypothetical protein
MGETDGGWRMEDEVSLVAPTVEVQADESCMLPERGKMTSTAGSHGHTSARGDYAVDYALSAGKSGTDVSKPHHPIGCCGSRDGGVLVEFQPSDMSARGCMMSAMNPAVTITCV